MIHEYGDNKVGSQYCSPTSQDSHIIGENSGGRICVWMNNMQMLVTLGETVKAMEVLWCGDWEALYLDIAHH